MLDNVSRLGSQRLEEYSLLHVCSTINYHRWISDETVYVRLGQDSVECMYGGV